MVRRAWFGLGMLLVAACSGAHGSGAAWPKPHAREADGGESLAPRPKTQIAAAVAASDGGGGGAAAAVEAPAAATPASATPAVTAPPASVEETTIEDITIEVDE